MNAKNVATTTGGVAITLLGLLWFLQGAGLVHVQPILCFADCEPLVGGSVGWLIAGIVGMIVGMLFVRRGARRTA
jgi:hypothetical protein